MRAGIEPLLGAQQRRLCVHIPASFALHATKHVLGPAVDGAVQETLGRCSQRLGKEEGIHS